MCVALVGLAGHVELRAQTTKEEAREALEMASGLAEGDEPGKALPLLRNAVRHFKKDPNAWYYLGIIELRTGDFQSAEKSFHQATKLHSSFMLAHVGRARAFLLLNDRKAAEKEGRIVIRTGASEAEAHYVFGSVHLLAGDASRCLQEIEAALKINGSFAPPLLLKYQALLHSLVSSGVGDILKDPALRRQIMNEAARALDQYFTLEPGARNDSFLMEQAKAVRFHAEALAADATASDRKVFKYPELDAKARIFSKPEALYSSAARANLIMGKVVLDVVFTAEGEVKHILVMKSLPFGLTKNSIEAAQRMKFKAATKDGKPVAMYAQLEYYFTIY